MDGVKALLSLVYSSLNISLISCDLLSLRCQDVKLLYPPVKMAVTFLNVALWKMEHLLQNVERNHHETLAEADVPPR